MRFIQNLLCPILCVVIVTSLFYSCSSKKLVTTALVYQSVRTKYAQPTQISPIPNDAKIAVAYTISQTGDLHAIVYNRTSDIMIIDQTKSFFVNSDGKSTSYYDPTVRTTSATDMSSVTKGGSVNLGAVAGAIGIGGTLGQIANGINLGGSGTSGQAITNSTYISDQPKVSLAPNSNGSMSKVFNVSGIGENVPYFGNSTIHSNMSEENSDCRFNVCISYSLDNGKTFNQLITEFYVDSKMIIPINVDGRVNNAVRQVLSSKPDAVSVPCWLMVPLNNKYSETGIDNGVLYDYQ